MGGSRRGCLVTIDNDARGLAAVVCRAAGVRRRVRRRGQRLDAITDRVTDTLNSAADGIPSPTPVRRRRPYRHRLRRAPTPAPASIELSGSQVKQGGFLIVRLMSPPGGLAEVTAYFRGPATRCFRRARSGTRTSACRHGSP